MKNSLVHAVCVAAALLSATPVFSNDALQSESRAPRGYTITEIPLPVLDEPCAPGFQSSILARALNERGQVTGTASCFVAGVNEDGTQRLQARAFAWSPRWPSYALPAPDMTANYQGRAINAHGEIVGFEFGEVDQRAMLWNLNGGVMEAIPGEFCPVLSLTAMLAHDITNSRHVLGAGTRPIAPGVCTSSAVIQTPTGNLIVGPTGLRPNAMNENLVMVGTLGGAGAAKWSQATGLTLLTNSDRRSGAWQINERGDIVGWVNRTFNPGATCPFTADPRLWKADGTEVVLPKPADLPATQAYGINDAGDIVGIAAAEACDSQATSEVSRAVLWTNGTLIDLNRYVPRWRRLVLLEATAINNRGQILVTGRSLDAARDACPRFVADPVTGEGVYDPSQECYSRRSFLLTPR
jgi:probable HAF family extracellular repeat protein